MVSGLNDVISEIQSWSGLITSEVDNTLTMFCVSNALPRLFVSRTLYFVTYFVGGVDHIINE
jgi:hypothetical protein